MSCLEKYREKGMGKCLSALVPIILCNSLGGKPRNPGLRGGQTGHSWSEVSAFPFRWLALFWPRVNNWWREKMTVNMVAYSHGSSPRPGLWY